MYVDPTVSISMDGQSVLNCLFLVSLVTFVHACYFYPIQVTTPTLVHK